MKVYFFPERENKLKSNRRGFGILPALISLAVIGFAFMALINSQKAIRQSSAQSRVSFRSDMIVRSLSQILSNPNAWTRTRVAIQNSRVNGPALDCLAGLPGNHCTVSGGAYEPGVNEEIKDRPIRSIRFGNNFEFINLGNPAHGFDMSGRRCNTFVAAIGAGNPDCPLRPIVTWTAICNSAASCNMPGASRVNVSVLYNPPALLSNPGAPLNSVNPFRNLSTFFIVND